MLSNVLAPKVKGKETNNTVNLMVGKAWKALAENEKQQFNKQAKDDKLRYLKVNYSQKFSIY